jgi:hypothetical protein
VTSTWRPPRDYGWIYALALFGALVLWIAGACQ